MFDLFGMGVWCVSVEYEIFCLKESVFGLVFVGFVGVGFVCDLDMIEVFEGVSVLLFFE